MARLAHIVVSGSAPHVTQRGNCRREVFFKDADYPAHVGLVFASCSAARADCLVWRLMPKAGGETEGARELGIVFL